MQRAHFKPDEYVLSRRHEAERTKPKKSGIMRLLPLAKRLTPSGREKRVRYA
jgi:hypothetical protein